jgi:hypothetical protein
MARGRLPRAARGWWARSEGVLLDIAHMRQDALDETFRLLDEQLDPGCSFPVLDWRQKKAASATPGRAGPELLK